MTSNKFPAGNTHNLVFEVQYSSTYSEVAKRSTNVLQSEVSDAKFMIKNREKDNDSEAVITKTLTSGITMVDGKATVALTASDTQNIDGAYCATLRLFLTSGSVLDFIKDNEPSISLSIDRGCVKAVS